MMSLFQIGGEIAQAAHKAVEKHGNFTTIHEVYGVLAEEVDEFFEEVKAQQHEPMLLRGELLDIAATCAKAIEQIDLMTLGRKRK
jgi:DNA-binding ferritin-like protein (Dps family)